jgi:hypothetical protein
VDGFERRLHRRRQGPSGQNLAMIASGLTFVDIAP